MKLTELEQEIVAHYDEDDAGFAKWAVKRITDHFAAMKPSTSKIDPQRLGTQSVLYSKIKQAILDKVGPMEVDGRETSMKAFNEMQTLKEQLRFQALARQSGRPRWVLALQLVPANLEAFIPPGKLQLTEIRAKADKGKLQQEMEEIDGDRLLEKLMPNLTSSSARNKRHAIVAALLLATGRRTTEVLQSGELYLSKEQTIEGYECMFKGQLKQGLGNGEPYPISLLAPYVVVKAAWDRVRSLYPTDGMTTEEVNAAYSSTLNIYCERTLGLHPHALRAVYAMATYQLLGPKKMSLVGWVSRVLGHSQPAAAAYYQRVKIVNLSGPWKVEAPKIEEAEESEAHGWILNGAVEKKRLPGLLQMMEQRVRMTATSIRAHAGSTMPVIQRIMANNAALIDDYNASLEE